MSESPTPELTLIVVVRDAARFLPRTLDMAFAQDVLPRRVVCIIAVDPSTTDETERIAREASTGARIPTEVFRASAPSLAVGWSEAIERARTPYVMRWDAHGEYPENFVSVALARLQAERPNTIVGGPCLSIADPDTESAWATAICDAENSVLVRASAFRREASKLTQVSTLARAAYPLHAFARVGLFRNLPFACEDADCHARLRNAGYVFLCDPEIRSRHFVRSSPRQLWRQKFRNGAGVAWLSIDAPSSFRPLHMAPGFGLVAGVSLVCATAVGSISPLLPVVAAGAYVAAIVGAASKAAGRFAAVPRTAFAIAIIHLAYGIGAVWGATIRTLGGSRPVPRLPPNGTVAEA